MTADRWIVLVGGLLLVAFIVWFFWLKRTRGVRAAGLSGAAIGSSLPRNHSASERFSESWLAGLVTAKGLIKFWPEA